MSKFSNDEERKESWYNFVGEDLDYAFAEDHEERLWFCAHGKAYGIRCRRCDEEDDV